MKIILSQITDNYLAAKVHHEQFLTAVAFFQEHNIAKFYDKFPTISQPNFLRFCLDAINAHLEPLKAEAFKPYGQGYDFGYLSQCLQNDKLHTKETQETFINDLVDCINDAEENGAYPQYMVAVEFLSPFVDPDVDFY